MTSSTLAPRGQLVLLALVFFAVFLTIVSGLVTQVVTYARSERATVAAEQAIMLAEAGIDKAAYQLNADSTYSGESNTALGAGTYTITVTNIDGASKWVSATGYVPNSTSPTAKRTVKVKVVKNANYVTFRYGTQAGQGGIIFANNSALEGNLYSNGNIVGSNGAYITGDTFVANPSGGGTGSITSMCIGGVSSGGACLVSGGVTGQAEAHTVTGTSVTGALYCQSGSSNNKSCDTSMPDPTQQPMPVDDANITKWKSDAASGTIINGDYTVSSGSVTLGPTKINGNLTISGNATVTLANTVWVTGNVTFSGTGGGARVKLANTYGAQSGLIIADGLISIGNNVTFQDSGTSGSYIMLLTTSTCDETTTTAPCSSKNAIDISNNASIVIANAESGTVNFANNASVKEVVGKTIRLKNNVKIQYGSGLPSTLFQSGPGGSWAYAPGTYTIIH
jgi:hypothetical protein